VKEGKADVEKLPGDKAGAGVQLDAKALAQLYGGYITARKAAEAGVIVTSKDADLAGMQAVLSPPGQPIPYMADDF
ncbi:MAG: sterol carrier protein domain-containing protein, partial [Chloroflexota bacterium]|nr:sterol carrier protein domain-containing protein [Chloroflexota bacterium]